MGIFFIGVGLGSVKHLTKESIEVIDRCHKVLVDTYTGYIDEGLRKFLVSRKGDGVGLAERKMLEDHAPQLVEYALGKDLGIIVPGDPFIATTHEAIRSEAQRRGVSVKVVHGVSIISAAISASGLHVYKFGKTATLPKTEDTNQLTQPYLTILENMALNLHTLLLLDTADGGLTIAGAIEELEAVERVLGRGVIRSDLLVIGLARVGLDGEKVSAGRVGELADSQYPPPPHCLVIPSELHFTERESIKTYAIDPLFVENYSPPNSLRDRVWKYAEKCRKIIDGLEAARIAPSITEIVRTYVEDSLNFFLARDVVNSLLAIGYAEGLLDALRLRGEADFTWEDAR